MKRNNLFIYIFIIAFISLPVGRTASEAAIEALPIPQDIAISMDLQDASLNDILKVFSMQSGMNFIASEAVKDRKITLFLDKVPLKEALDKLFQANNLSYDLYQDSNIIIIKDWGKPTTDTVTRIFQLKYASVSTASLVKESGMNASSISAIIKTIMSSSGSVTEDSRTNSLVVTDIPAKMPLIEKTIAGLDIPAPQVMIEVEMLDVNKSITDELGFNYGQTPFTVILSGASMATGFPFKSWSKIYPDSSNRGSIGINSSSSYQVTLDFLKSQSDTKSLARPKLLTLNNMPAEIKITTDEAIGLQSTTTSSESTATSTQEAERTETGVSLKVTPQVNIETGEITMYLVPTVSEAKAGGTFGTGSNATTFKDPEERSTKSTVRIKDGETVIIGGLLRNESSETIKKLPVLGDIPVLGMLFRHKEVNPKKERELLVFITPHIIKDSGNALAAAKPRASQVPEREQGVAVGYDRRTAIDSSLDNYDTMQ